MKYFRIRIVIEGNSIYTAALTQPIQDESGDGWKLQNLLQNQPKGCSTIGKIDWTYVSALVWSVEEFDTEVEQKALSKTRSYNRKR
jgi:hypothetical protein